MVEDTHWHPVALTDALAQQPLAVTLLERPLVLWRDAAGQARAWADQCPHRGARLSLGRVQGNHLECAYHGWQFAPSGECVVVPALPGFQPPPGHCARVYEASERHGLIWVRLAVPGADADPAGVEWPIFTPEGDAQLRKLNCGPYDVDTSAPRVVENFLDMSHFGVVHDGWLGSRALTAVEAYDVQPTPLGLVASNCKAWQPQSNLHSSTGALVEYRYEVTAPYSAVLSKVPDADSVAIAGFRESIGLYVCPVAPERSRVWFRLAVADFESPIDTLQAFQHTIFMQDKPVLESQTPKRLPLEPGAECHGAADRASAAYRRHLRQLGITFGVC